MIGVLKNILKFQRVKMTTKKTIHNECPICKLPRGKGQYEFAHGKCAEIRAATEGKKSAFPDHPTLKRITVEMQEKGKANNRKKKFKKMMQKLPDYMYS